MWTRATLLKINKLSDPLPSNVKSYTYLEDHYCINGHHKRCQESSYTQNPLHVFTVIFSISI